MFYHQTPYDIRLEWGEQGIDALAPISEAVIIIDILSFTTCVDICLSRNTTVYPFPWGERDARSFANSRKAILASKRKKFDTAYSLSPSSLIKIPEHTKLVLPSPNGSTLTLRSSQHCKTFAGCLRNAEHLSQFLNKKYQKISIIPCGER